MKPYYQDDHYGITIYHGDCREVLPELPQVDLVLTDPPYRKVTCGKGKKSLGGMLDRNSDLVNSGKLFTYNDTSFSDWLPVLFKVLSNKTHCYVFCDYLNTKELLSPIDN